MQDQILRQTIINFLNGGEAFSTFDEIISEFPENEINSKAPNVDYTFWHLLEHLRITQLDILDFLTNKNYKEIAWPNDYWPAKDKKANKTDWDKSIKTFKSDLEKIISLVKNPKTDLFSKILWGNGQTILREAILVAEHNAYHLGEFSILRQVNNNWGKNHK